MAITMKVDHLASRRRVKSPEYEIWRVTVARNDIWRATAEHRRAAPDCAETVRDTPNFDRAALDKQGSLQLILTGTSDTETGADAGDWPYPCGFA